MTSKPVTTHIGLRLHEMSRLLRLDAPASLVDTDVETVSLALDLIEMARCEPGDFALRLADAADAVARRCDLEAIVSADNLSELMLLLFAIDEVEMALKAAGDDIVEPDKEELWRDLEELHASLAAVHAESMADPWGRVSAMADATWLEIECWEVPVDLWFLPWADLNNPDLMARLVAARCPGCHRPAPAGAA